MSGGEQSGVDGPALTARAGTLLGIGMLGALLYLASESVEFARVHACSERSEREVTPRPHTAAPRSAEALHGEGRPAPVPPIAGPEAGPEAALAPTFFTDRAPATPAAERILRRLGEITRGASITRYAHFTRVDPRVGSYVWDCSGMVGWVLRQESPVHFGALRMSRPLARDFARLVQHSSTLYPRRRWRRVLRLVDARAGDVFAWHRESEFATGHVGFLLAAARPVPGFDRTFDVRVADSTATPHAADTRTLAGDSDGGLGEGTMTFLTDEMGRAVAYRWAGAASSETVQTRIWLGRLE